MSKRIKEPTSCYHFAETYLNKEQIERVLNHYRDYISAALYILHDKDKHQVEDDGGVRRRELSDEYNKLVKEINAIEIGVNNAFDIKKTMQFESDEIKANWVRANITIPKRNKTLKQKKATKINDELRLLEKALEEQGTLKKPHYHILLKCYGAHTVSAVRKWFYRFRVTEEVKNDETGEIETRVVNTLDSICDSVATCRDYLTHKNEPEDSGKFVYDRKDVHTYGAGWQAFNKAGRSTDDVLDILDRINSGESLRNLARDYGRDVVINISKYRSFAYMMEAQEDDANDLKHRENEIVRRGLKDPDTDWSYLLTLLSDASYIASVANKIKEEVSLNR